MELHKLSPLEVLKITKKNINKESITFVQIGVNDGVSYDIANEILTTEDIGFFVEPIDSTFNTMCINKSDFKKCLFVKKAILPESLKFINKINLLSDDNANLGASFGKFNKDRVSEQISVDTITVSDFLEEYKITNLDYLFCDAESIDHLIILDFLNYITPNVLFFETCWWCNEEVSLEISNGDIIKIPSREYMKKKLTEKGYVVIDYWENVLHKREDIIAIKLNIIKNNE
jgi:hypothetical protein